MKLVDYQMASGGRGPEHPDQTAVFAEVSDENCDFPLLLEPSSSPMPNLGLAPELALKQQIVEPDEDVLLLKFPDSNIWFGEYLNTVRTSQDAPETFLDRDEVLNRVQPEVDLAEALAPHRALTTLSLFAMRLGGTGENPEWNDSPGDGSAPKFVVTQGLLEGIGNRPRTEMRGVTANAMSLLQTAVDTSYVADEVLDYPGLAQHLYGVLAEIETAASAAGVHLTQSHSKLQGRECAEQSLLGRNAQERLVRLARVAAIGNLLSGHVIPVRNSEERPFNSDPSVRNKIVVTSPGQES